jgi:2'-5' RNA ligase
MQTLATRSIPRRDAREPAARMFFALWPDAPARAALAGLAHAIARTAGGRAPAVANLHLTLAFVGHVAPDRVAVLREAGRGVAAEISPFTLVLDRVGAFRDGGIAWIGAAEIAAGLADIAERLARRLSVEGFRVDRRAYAPHLTLARKCQRLPADARMARITWRVGELALVESVLRPDGPFYRDDSRWPLAACAAPDGG